MNDSVEFSDTDEIRIQMLYEQMSDVWFHRNKRDNQKIRIICRNVSNVIHDCRNVWTGYISINALDRLNFTRKAATVLCAYDHFYGRMNSGSDIVNMFMDDQPEYEMYRNAMYQHCKVHRVLKEENNRLRAYQNNRGMSWQNAYTAAGIKLVFIEMGQKKRLTKQILKSHEYGKPVSLARVNC